MAVLTNARLNAMWQVAATLNFSGTNSLTTILTTQPDGVYALANMNDMIPWLKWELGKDGSLAKWFPNEVYQAILAGFENFAYNKTAIIASKAPPTNASGGSGQCTCDEDPTGAARDVICWKWNYVDFDSQAAGSLDGGTWTFSGLDAGNYVLTYDDYSTNESFPTTYLTVT